MEKRLGGTYTRMLRAILSKSWKQHPTKQQLYGHLPPITKTIKVRRTRHAGHCWRIKYELISDVLLWNPSHGRANAGRTARTYIQQLFADTGCSPEDLPEAMDNREGGEIGSGRSLLMAWRDDDDDDIHIYISLLFCECNFSVFLTVVALRQTILNLKHIHMQLYIWSGSFLMSKFV